MYNPLPEEVTIKSSKIHGFGVFATCDINKGHEFGITHVRHNDFLDGYIRTPLGGFFNHSEYPNCEAYKIEDYIQLRAISNIKVNEELTATYWLYSVKEKEHV